MISTKVVVCALLANFVLLTLVPVSLSADSLEWWDDAWSFRQEIIIPIDTSNEQAKYQPIDLHISLDNPCWAKDEIEHSVRVVFQNGESLQELESQIYDLDYSDDYYIKACSLVFLIPEKADGEEKYYLYYDGSEKPSPDYTDHVEIEEDYYYFAPIPGFPFESHYYKITEDGYVTYGVAIGGEFLGYSTCQQITIFSEGTTEVATPKDGDCYASFDYFYYYGKGPEDFSSTIQSLISKEIFIDGNLMVEFGIVSGTGRDDFSNYSYVQILLLSNGE